MSMQGKLDLWGSNRDTVAQTLTTFYGHYRLVGVEARLLFNQPDGRNQERRFKFREREYDEYSLQFDLTYRHDLDQFDYRMPPLIAQMQYASSTLLSIFGTILPIDPFTIEGSVEVLNFITSRLADKPTEEPPTNGK